MGPATKVQVDEVPGPGLVLAEALPPGTTPFHAHARHQVLYADAGALELEVEGAGERPGTRFWLPPLRAAFVPAGLVHRVHTRAPAALLTAYLTTVGASPSAALVVFRTPPLLRELLRYGVRYGATTDLDPGPRARLFGVFADSLPEWLFGALPLGLPEARSPELRRALGFARGNLRGARLTDAAQAAGVSPRTLARRFEDELGLSFRAWLRLLRLLEAAVLLEDEALRIGEVAARVGFESQSAFTHAFRALYAESPRTFRAGAPSRRRRRDELSR